MELIKSWHSAGQYIMRIFVNLYKSKRGCLIEELFHTKNDKAEVIEINVQTSTCNSN